MPTLYLTEDDVRQTLSMRAAIGAVQEAFARWAEGEAENIPRARSRTSSAVLHSMSASLRYANRLGWKNYVTTRGRARFHVALYDGASGEMLALIEANRLGQIRTGAATGVAVQYMAAPEASELGLFGTGWQAESQLEAVATVRPIRQAFVYSRDAERRARFAATMSARLGIEVIPVDRPQQAVEDLPIVVTATSSTKPVFDGTMLAEGSLLCAMGSNWLHRAEIDADAIRLADNIVCDSVAACRIEAGDFVDALERGLFDWARAVELKDVVSGRAAGRVSPSSIGLFKSVGLALEDVAVACVVHEEARKQGLGRQTF